MARWRVLPCVLLALCCSCFCAGTAAFFGTSDPDPPGSREVGPQEQQFFVTLYSPEEGGARLCSGTLLSPHLVVTARGCIPPIPGTNTPDTDFLPIVEVGRLCEGAADDCTLLARVPVRRNRVRDGPMALLLLDGSVSTAATPKVDPNLTYPATGTVEALVSGGTGRVHAVELSLDTRESFMALVSAARFCSSDAGGGALQADPAGGCPTLVGLVVGCEPTLDVALFDNTDVGTIAGAISWAQEQALPLGPGTLDFVEPATATDPLGPVVGLAVAGPTLYMVGEDAIWAVDTPSGATTQLAQLPASVPEFHRAGKGLALSADAGVLYMADGPRLLKVDTADGSVAELANNGDLKNAVDVAFVDGWGLFVADLASNMVWKVDPSSGDIIMGLLDHSELGTRPSKIILASGPLGELLVFGGQGLARVRLADRSVTPLVSDPNWRPEAIAANHDNVFAIVGRDVIVIEVATGNISLPNVANIKMQDRDDRRKLSVRRPYLLAVDPYTHVNQTIYLAERTGDAIEPPSIRTVPVWAMFHTAGRAEHASLLHFDW